MRGGGLFVTFEGIEGSGKTTQVRRAARAIRAHGFRVVATRQPGGTPLGARLRRILLRSEGPLDPRSELLLMVADRRQHLSQLIEPALSTGAVILCDRYADASRAYQGAGRRLGEELVDDLHALFGCRLPDRTYLFDLPVPTALNRLERPGRTLDRIEKEEAAFHERVRRSYLGRARREPGRFRVLDARLPVPELTRLIVADLVDRLSGPPGAAPRPRRTEAGWRLG